MALCLDKSLLQFEVPTTESGGQVIGLKDHRIVAYIVVEVDYFVVLGQMERVLNQIALVTFKLHIGDLHIINEAYDLIKDLVLGLTESA